MTDEVNIWINKLLIELNCRVGRSLISSNFYLGANRVRRFE